jgi:hypothetical protein
MSLAPPRVAVCDAPSPHRRPAVAPGLPPAGHASGLPLTPGQVLTSRPAAVARAVRLSSESSAGPSAFTPPASPVHLPRPLEPSTPTDSGVAAGPAAEPPLTLQPARGSPVSRAAAPQPRLFDAPLQPPLPPEAASVQAPISRSAAPSPEEWPPAASILTPTAADSLPFARPEAWPGASLHADETWPAAPSAVGALTAGLPPVSRPLTPGPPGRTVRRSTDAPSTGASTGGAGAVGEIGPADDPAKADQDLDKLTEKVWQRIRRTLQLERERRRGLP